MPLALMVGVLVGLLILAACAFAACRLSSRADASTENAMAMRAAEPIQQGLDVGKGIADVASAAVSARRRSWIGRDQATPARRSRLKAMQRRRRRIRIHLESRVNLVSEGQILDARPTLQEAVTRAREILVDRTRGVQVIYFYDEATGGYRGWLNLKDVA